MKTRAARNRRIEALVVGASASISGVFGALIVIWQL